MRTLRLAALCLSVVISTFGSSRAQNAGSAPAAASSSFSPVQLDQMVAPVALYPDPLLTDVLTASTYPLEVVDADHWAADPQNSGLSGDDLNEALGGKGWDPSVQSLVPFPDVLQLLDNHLEWMETLGEAFLAQPDDVMDAIQRMRGRARTAGNLPSNGEETVTDQDGAISVSPPSDLIYIPQYNPWCAFGDSPLASPTDFGSWSGSCDPADYGVVFGPGIAWPFSFWGWGYFDWHHHHILIRPDRYSQFHSGRFSTGVVWQHDPQHRAGVRYRIPRNARVFGQAVAPRARFQTWRNVPTQPGRSPLPVRNWNSSRIFHAPPRRAMPVAGSFRPGSGRGAFANGHPHAARAPVQH